MKLRKKDYYTLMMWIRAYPKKENSAVYEEAYKKYKKIMTKIIYINAIDGVVESEYDDAQVYACTYN